MFLYWIKLISQKSFALIWSSSSFEGDKGTQTIPAKWLSQHKRAIRDYLKHLLSRPCLRGWVGCELTQKKKDEINSVFLIEFISITPTTTSAEILLESSMLQYKG